MSEQLWREGNRLKLLENGEEFFPAVFEDIARAKHEVLIETFIVFEDEIGLQLRDVLVEAARRGVRVEFTVDGYGSSELSKDYIDALTAAGVRLHVYDPRPPTLGMRTHVFRRLHRKIVVVDQAVAYVGGINYSHDHVLAHGEGAKQDYALRIEGPLVADIHAFTLSAIGLRPRPYRLSERLTLRNFMDWRRQLEFWKDRLNWTPGVSRAIFVSRDNSTHRTDIEQHYRLAFKHAQREIIIANAYFFPGYRFLRELEKAARRGVAVHILIQGKPDKWIVQFAASALYSRLLGSGVKLYEYCARPMHAKVATVDDEWVTVGSSNLDPLSLYLNLECNVIARDKVLNADMRTRLHDLMQHNCRTISNDLAPHRTLWKQLISALAFHLIRRFPSWIGWVPAQPPRFEVHVPLRQALPGKH